MHAFLHISDLHRSGNRPINNDDLISSILTDLERPLPGLGRIGPLAGIIVSGDLAQGLPLDSTEYPDGLTKQYKETAEFLARLADKLVNGDRSRIVIGPGQSRR